PPPEPADEIKEAGTGPDLQNDVESVFGGFQKEREDGRENEDAQRCDPSGQHVMLFTGVTDYELPIEIVDQIGSAPVQVGQDGRGIRGQQTANHEADETGRKELEHGRVSDVVTEQFRIQMRESLLDIGKFGINQQRTKSDQDPRPGPQDIM